MNTYKQGHDKHSTATHERRTAQSDAAFILPHIGERDRILDVGCGPGTITLGFREFAKHGEIVGIDLSPEVLEKARDFAGQTKVPSSGPGSVVFQEGNILQGLTYADDSFDIVFASQVLGHIPLPGLPVKALSEMRRVLKPGGILATRDAIETTAFPRSLRLKELFFDRYWKVLADRNVGDDSCSTLMPVLCQKAGFNAEKITIEIGSTIVQTREERQFTLDRFSGLFAEGTAAHENWIRAGFSKSDVTEALDAIRKWAETEGAWYVGVQCETLARK